VARRSSLGIRLSGWTRAAWGFKRKAAMRKLPLWIALVILAGVAYLAWPDPRGSSSSAAATQEAGALPPHGTAREVPFLVKSKTRQIFEEWKSLARARSAGDREAVWIKINLALEAIRQRLHRDGAYAPGAMREAMLAAAREMGLDERGAAHVINTMLDGPEGAQNSGSILGGAIGRAVGAVATPSAAEEPEK
jgi:hypothetical protein